MVPPSTLSCRPSHSTAPHPDRTLWQSESPCSRCRPSTCCPGEPDCPDRGCLPSKCPCLEPLPALASPPRGSSSWGWLSKLDQGAAKNVFLPCEVAPSCLALLLAFSPTSSHPLLVVHSVSFHLIIMMMVMMKMMIVMKTRIMTRSGWRTRVVEAPQGRERPVCR